MQTEIVKGELGIARAVELLRAGEIVALPTETVYGLAADALNVSAVAKIFEAKARPRFDPLIVHLPKNEWLEMVAIVSTDNRALLETLVAQFWPGPLTIVLPKTDLIPALVTSGLETVAVRRSGHPIFGEVIRRFGAPLSAPSANRFGRISATTAAAVKDELRIPCVLDGGAAELGIESTVIRLLPDAIQVLRPGPVTNEMLAEFAAVKSKPHLKEIMAPGQLASHYAPRTKMVVVEEISKFIVPANTRVGAICFGSAAPLEAMQMSRSLSREGDLREAAANLFQTMRELDTEGLDLIVAELVPENGIGVAINDRLRRAAAP